MEVDLSPFFAGATCALVDSRGAELAISRAFASAANARREEHQLPHSWNQTQPHRSRVSVVVQLRINSPLPSWTRQAKDVVLRCVDRAVSRIFPPLDVLQYIAADSPVFPAAAADASGKRAASHLCVSFAIQPSAALWPASLCRRHAVEGEVMAGVQPGGPETGTAAALQSMHDTLLDRDLWNRARAAHQLYDASVARDAIQQRTGNMSASEATVMDTIVALQSQQQACEEKQTQLQWQLARWLTELFMNEGSWARPPGSLSTGTSRSVQKAPAYVATRRLFQNPLRLSFADVVDAALSAPQTTAHSTASGAAVPRRLLHADVRGVEWDGLLVGYTSRYAYIAVPYFVAPAETAAVAASSSVCLWSFVSRIPIPAILGESADRDAEGHRCANSPFSRKRPRTSGSPHPDDAISKEESTAAAAARNVLACCFNAEEVMRHDTNAEAVFRLADTPCVVTVQAHRLYCARADPARQPRMHATAPSLGHASTKPQPAASPYALSLVLEDAYAVRARPTLNDSSATPTSSASSTATHWATSLLCRHDPPLKSEDVSEEGGSAANQSINDTIVRALHTFSDVVGAVRESCHRFQRAHERFCALYAQCVQMRGSTIPTPAGAAAQAEAAVTDKLSSARAQRVLTRATMPVPEATVTREALLPTVAAENLRLLRQAEVVYSALSDSVSVHFGKLRGAARVPVPVVRTTADVAQLEECHNVEFKAKVGLVANGPSAGVDSQEHHHPALMDVERLRNTMAAMATCRGGVILLGVTDDGRILGHARQLNVARQLRTSGFCPAMVKDTVQVKELRWLGENGDIANASGASLSECNGNGSSPPVKRSMPANWWKRSATLAASELPKTSTAKVGSSTGDQVITVVSVQKGQAPFYATFKNAPPYQRGCASTTMMPTMVVARRIMKELT
ncbi:hypothetical protein MNV84_05003 [Leishmania braziliensis]|nr:hypothetical protein MNV84_05003 [Leishmania braziliensis]